MGTSISPNPGAYLASFAPFADNAGPVTPSKTPDAVALDARQAGRLPEAGGQALLENAAVSFAGALPVTRAPDMLDPASCTLRPEEAVGQARGKRDVSTTKITIERVDGPLSELLKGDDLRAELDKVVDVAKGMDVKEIEIKGYFPFFSEFGKMRAQAVKDFLVYRGVDEGLITAIGRGPGFGSKHAPLAKARAVVVEISGTPKQAVQGASSARPENPVVAHRLA
ncbi:hypothetical protein [Bordetella sp. H567]|uniref:hypothetical protein n=1 Tax=Bordetella sp. H567 TaxID=1697043 RepID=UPI0011AB83C9|nr:hypothetical protein [Bordetella sp. H567]